MTNVVVIIGRLVKDLELKDIGNGKSVANGTIAVNRGFKSADGQDADFINIVMFNKTAENTCKYTKKGSQIAVEGRIQTRSYDKDGKRVYITEVVANSVQFLDSKQDGNSTPSNDYSKPVAVDPFASNSQPIDISNSDLPF